MRYNRWTTQVLFATNMDFSLNLVIKKLKNRIRTCWFFMCWKIYTRNKKLTLLTMLVNIKVSGLPVHILSTSSRKRWVPPWLTNFSASSIAGFYNTLFKLLSEFNSFLSILLSGLNDIDWYIKLYFKTKKHSKNMHLWVKNCSKNLHNLIMLQRRAYHFLDEWWKTKRNECLLTKGTRQKITIPHYMCMFL